VSTTAPLAEVARTMAERGVGSALVEDCAGALAGIFTSADALRALADVLASESGEEDTAAG